MRDGHGLSQITALTEKMVKRVSDDGHLGPQDCVSDGGYKGHGA